MDFALFMERYGYKLLLGIMAAVIIGLFAVPIIGLVKVIKLYGPEIGLLIIITSAIYGFTVWRRHANAYGQAQGKYFYDDKWYKRR